MIVAELIAELQKYDQSAEVRVLASCCSHSHGIQNIKIDNEENPGEDPEAVVINARG